MDPKPSVGRIVHYHQTSGEAFAAIITIVFSDGKVGLQVFPPFDYDEPYRVQAYYSETPKHDHWSWPPRV